VLFGLVLPRGRDQLAIASVCLIAAGLTKSEASIASTAALLLMAWRYRPGLSGGRRRDVEARRAVLDSGPASGRGVSRSMAVWALTIVFILLFSGIGWQCAMHALGVSNRFFESPSAHQSFGHRVTATATALLPYLPLAVAAAACDVFTALRWRPWRARFALGSPTFVWLVVGSYMMALLGTYAVGSLPISGWLASSLSRTIVFVQLALAGEIATTGVLASGVLLNGGGVGTGAA
jgi:hypothetical protein